MQNIESLKWRNILFLSDIMNRKSVQLKTGSKNTTRVTSQQWLFSSQSERIEGDADGSSAHNLIIGKVCSWILKSGVSEGSDRHLSMFTWGLCVPGLMLSGCFSPWEGLPRQNGEDEVSVFSLCDSAWRGYMPTCRPTACRRHSVCRATASGRSPRWPIPTIETGDWDLEPVWWWRSLSWCVSLRGPS